MQTDCLPQGIRAGCALLLLLTCPLLCRSVAAQPANEPEPAAKPQQQITISPETTRIDGPLDDRGYVDYVEAVNRLRSRGLKPEMNYEVVVRQVSGPEAIAEAIRQPYYERLGIPVPHAPDEAARARYFVDFLSFVDSGQATRTADLKEFDALLTGPWDTAQYPRGARWLTRNEEALATLVEGSRRPQCYTPYIGYDDPEMPMPQLISVLLPSVQEQREFARALVARAMSRIARGDGVSAGEDLLTIHRQARLVGQGVTLIHALVGIALESMACQGELHLLTSKTLTRDQLQTHFNALNALPPLAPLADKLDIGERYMALDALQFLSRRSGGELFKGLQLIMELADAGPLVSWHYVVADQAGGAGPNDDPNGVQALQNLMSSKPIDWNVAMKLLNGYYDRMAAAGRESTRSKRNAALAAVTEDVTKIRAQLRGRLEQPDVKTAEGRGKVMGGLLAALLIPATESAFRADDRGAAWLQVTRAAFAAELYHAFRGSYPDSLARLSPPLARSALNDPCADQPLRYRATPQGMVVYSVGDNGKDDGGTTAQQQGPKGADDLVARLKIRAADERGD